MRSVKSTFLTSACGMVYRHVDVYSKNYDVRVFEALPLYLKAQVMDNHNVIYARDVCELHEYFYFARKPWDDQRARQALTKEEIARM